MLDHHPHPSASIPMSADDIATRYPTVVTTDTLTLDASPARDNSLVGLIARCATPAPRVHHIARLVPYTTIDAARPTVSQGQRALHEWQDAIAHSGVDYRVVDVDHVTDAADDDAMAALSTMLTALCGATVVVLGAGSCDGRRMALTLMADSDDARALAVDHIEAASSLRLDGDRVDAAGDPSADDYDPTFASGCYVAWMDTLSTADAVAGGVSSRGRVCH